MLLRRWELVALAQQTKQRNRWSSMRKADIAAFLVAHYADDTASGFATWGERVHVMMILPEQTVPIVHYAATPSWIEALFTAAEAENAREGDSTVLLMRTAEALVHKKCDEGERDGHLVEIKDYSHRAFRCGSVCIIQMC